MQGNTAGEAIPSIPAEVPMRLRRAIPLAWEVASPMHRSHIHAELTRTVYHYDRGLIVSVNTRRLWYWVRAALLSVPDNERTRAQFVCLSYSLPGRGLRAIPPDDAA